MKQKKLSRGARFGLAVASFFLGILLFVSVVATALIADVRVLTSKENLSEFISVIFDAALPSHAPASTNSPVRPGMGAVRHTRSLGLPRRDEPSGVASSLTDQLIGMLYEELGEQIGTGMPVSQEEFTSLINQSTAKTYIADKTAALITDYFNGEVTTTFEPEEIIQLINENAELIETVTGQPIPDDIAQQVATVFDQNEIVQKVEKEGLAGFMELAGGSFSGSDESMDSATSTGSTGKGSLADSLSALARGDLRAVNDIVAALREATSLTNLLIGIGICLVFAAAIVLVNFRQIPKGLRRAGYPLLLAGLGVVLNLAVMFAPEGEGAVSIAAVLVRYIFGKIFVVNIIVFCLGLALVIAGIVLGVILKKKETVPVTVPASPETEELAAALVDETPVEIVCEDPEETSDAEPAEEPAGEPAEEPASEEPAPVCE